VPPLIAAWFAPVILSALALVLLLIVESRRPNGLQFLRRLLPMRLRPLAWRSEAKEERSGPRAPFTPSRVRVANDGKGQSRLDDSINYRPEI
jgi:hypothetical protein